MAEAADLMMRDPLYPKFLLGGGALNISQLSEARFEEIRARAKGGVKF